MESLNSLIREAGPDDPLARAMEAIVDSGLILFTRDSGGHFVQLSEVLGARLRMGDARGKRQPGATQIFNGEGKPLAGAEYPATIVRTTGRAQRNVLRRIERGGEHVWAMMSTMPLERTADGYSALTIGADITKIVDARDTAERAAAVRGALVEAGTELVDGRVTRAKLVELLRGPMAALVPGGNVTLMQQDGDEFEMTSIHHGYGATAPAGRAHLSSMLRERWQGPEAHVNQDVLDTEIYSGTVVAELNDQYRSVAVAAAGRPEALASLMATHPEANGLDRWQIESLELAGRLVRAALYSDESWSERRSA